MEKLQEEESLAIYFCGRSNLEAGRSFVAAFEQLSERATSQHLCKFDK
jgi:hypothetical protein